jgi:hypothetical protein
MNPMTDGNAANVVSFGETKIHDEAYEQEALAAWRNIPFKSSLDLASAIREQLRLHGFDLKLGPDGSVLIIDTKGKHRSPPADIAHGVWERVETVGALLDQERSR